MSQSLASVTGCNPNTGLREVLPGWLYQFANMQERGFFLDTKISDMTQFLAAVTTHKSVCVCSLFPRMKTN